MISEHLANLRARFRRGAAATLDRDEFDPQVSKDTLVFVIGAYIVVAGAILLVGLPIIVLFGQSAGATYWVISVPVLTFIGAVIISWEAMRYWFGLRDARAAGTDTDEPTAFTSRTHNVRDILMTVVSITLGIILLVVVVQGMSRFV